MAKNRKDRQPGANDLRVAPEFAGNDLAAVLGKSSAETAASTEPSAADEWMVFGVDTVAQMAAESAARASGQSLGQWLSELIAKTIEEKK
ncbi:MAG: hypothetical protein ABI439_08335 [Rhodospirillales bacterium]